MLCCWRPPPSSHCTPKIGRHSVSSIRMTFEVAASPNFRRQCMRTAISSFTVWPSRTCWRRSRIWAIRTATHVARARSNFIRNDMGKSLADMRHHTEHFRGKSKYNCSIMRKRFSSIIAVVRWSVNDLCWRPHIAQRYDCDPLRTHKNDDESKPASEVIYFVKHWFAIRCHNSRICIWWLVTMT